MTPALVCGVKAGQFRCPDERKPEGVILVTEVYRKDYPNGDHAFRAKGVSLEIYQGKIDQGTFDLDCRSLVKMYPCKKFRIRPRVDGFENDK